MRVAASTAAVAFTCRKELACPSTWYVVKASLTKRCQQKRRRLSTLNGLLFFGSHFRMPPWPAVDVVLVCSSGKKYHARFPASIAEQRRCVVALNALLRD